MDSTGRPESDFLSSGSWTANDELWIYADIDDSRIEAVRLADGKEAWHVGAVYAADPIVADIWSTGAPGVRSVDPDTGQMGEIVGRSPDIGVETPTLGLADVVDNRIFGAYDEELSGTDDTGDGALRVWDLSSGSEEWSRAGETGDTFLGADEAGVYIGREISSDSGYRVIRRDADDGSEESLGTVETVPAAVTKVGDLLLVGSADATSEGGETTAYQMPSNGS